jgi:hypothetical protein
MNDDEIPEDATAEAVVHAVELDLAEVYPPAEPRPDAYTDETRAELKEAGLL